MIPINVIMTRQIFALTTMTEIDLTRDDPAFPLVGHTPVYNLPAETILQCLRGAAREEANAHILLGYFHVCSPWRRLLFGDHVLCGEIAFKFSHVKLITQFLTMAGSAPQRLDFDAILTRPDISTEEIQSFLAQLTNDRKRLSNAVEIKSTMPIPQTNWFAQLHSISNFRNLEELHINLLTVKDLPVIHAPNLRILTLLTHKFTFIPGRYFIAFLDRLPSLTELSLDTLSCSSVNLSPEHTSAQMPRLQQLNSKNIEFASYQSIRRLISNTPSTFNTSLSFMRPCALRDIWDSLEIRNHSSLHAALAASENAFELDLQNSSLDDYSHDFNEDLGISAGPGFLQKRYIPREQPASVNHDILSDTSLYAEHVEIVSLNAITRTGWAAPLLLNDLTGLRVLNWLRALPHPTTLVIDTSMRVLIERGMDFIWPSLHSIYIHCRTHRFALREDDQAAVDAVAQWIQSPVLDHEMHVILVGRKWKHYNLLLDALIDGCADFVDRREP